MVILQLKGLFGCALPKIQMVPGRYGVSISVLVYCHVWLITVNVGKIRSVHFEK